MDEQFKSAFNKNLNSPGYFLGTPHDIHISYLKLYNFNQWNDEVTEEKLISPVHRLQAMHLILWEEQIFS